ncbi:hypothetical protein LY78DRAFT_291064 [Colletotrichum sublineola]|nr:hypothetical protein LY78DRAFT_291064 [Colletotrichum sublineola]
MGGLLLSPTPSLSLSLPLSLLSSFIFVSSLSPLPFRLVLTVNPPPFMAVNTAPSNNGKERQMFSNTIEALSCSFQGQTHPLLVSPPIAVISPKRPHLHTACARGAEGAGILHHTMPRLHNPFHPQGSN